MMKATPSIFYFYLFIFSSLFQLGYLTASAQEKPPIPVTVEQRVEVNTARNLSLGSIVPGNSQGYVTVHPREGSTFSNVYLIRQGLAVGPALFDVYANPGTILTVQVMGETYLDNSNGSGRLILKDISYATEKREGFLPATIVTSKSSNEIGNEFFVGGTLEVPSDAPPGRYNGNLTLTFIHQ